MHFLDLVHKLIRHFQLVLVDHTPNTNEMYVHASRWFCGLRMLEALMTTANTIRLCHLLVQFNLIVISNFHTTSI